MADKIDISIALVKYTQFGHVYTVHTFKGPLGYSKLISKLNSVYWIKQGL